LRKVVRSTSEKKTKAGRRDPEKIRRGSPVAPSNAREGGRGAEKHPQQRRGPGCVSIARERSIGAPASQARIWEENPQKNSGGPQKVGSESARERSNPPQSKLPRNIPPVPRGKGPELLVRGQSRPGPMSPSRGREGKPGGGRGGGGQRAGRGPDRRGGGGNASGSPSLNSIRTPYVAANCGRRQ